jgi:hypothetical protein
MISNVKIMRGLTLFTAVCIAGCFAEEWTGTIYPDRKRLQDSESTGIFASLEECRMVSRRRLLEVSDLDVGDYECGLNCKPMFPELPDSVLVCKETLR